MSNYRNIPWVEKYRPKSFDDLILDDNVKNKIITIIKNKQIPNMILSGIPSTGKTSTALCIITSILKQSNFNKNNFIELNASDDRGVDAIKNDIITFCQNKSDQIKIILLDEADNITSKGQQLLNNLMDKYNNNKFIFTCNDSRQIMESIQSRCIILRFKKININLLLNRLKYICECEKISYKESGLKKIIELSDFDIRQCINMIEAVYYGYNKINKKNVQLIFPKISGIKDMIRKCTENDIIGAYSYLQNILEEGHYHNNILLSMNRLIENLDMNEGIKIKIIDIINKYYIKEINTKIQLCACLAELCNVLSK